MNRKTMFIKPHGITHGTRHYYSALVNGQWVEGDYAQVMREYETGKREHAKKMREQRQQKGEQQ